MRRSEGPRKNKSGVLEFSHKRTQSTKDGGALSIAGSGADQEIEPGRQFTEHSNFHLGDVNRKYQIHEAWSIVVNFIERQSRVASQACDYTATIILEFT